MLLDLLDIKTRARVADAITKAIGASFVTHDQAVQTDAEVKRRFEICLELAQVMRNDLKWSWVRVCDALPQALNDVLTDGEWVPPARSAWHTTESGLILPH